MNTVFVSLTVCFEDPFWVGIYEVEEDGALRAAKVTFGAEPRDGEVYEYSLRIAGRLRLSPPVPGGAVTQLPGNPKRAQREAARYTRPQGVGTKAQQALKLQQEQGAAQRRERAKERQREEKQLRFELHRRKKKEQHRGK